MNLTPVSSPGTFQVKAQYIYLEIKPSGERQFDSFSSRNPIYHKVNLSPPR